MNNIDKIITQFDKKFYGVKLGTEQEYSDINKRIIIDFLKQSLSQLQQQTRESVTIELNNSWLEDMKKWRNRHEYEISEDLQSLFNKCKTERGLSRALSNYIILLKNNE